MRDIHQTFNLINIEELDYNQRSSSKYIDSIAVSESLKECIDSSKLFKI